MTANSRDADPSARSFPGLAREAAEGLDALLAEAKRRVRARVSSEGRVSA
jgi:hypothetical protein